MEINVVSILFRFGVGLALGSFLNVIALRYKPDAFLFAREAMGGRSRCPGCGQVLRWFELIPLISFVLQKGECRRCSIRLSWRYPVVELCSGLILAFVPVVVQQNFIFAVLAYPYIFTGLWVLALYALFLAALIDLRLKIIPDELNIIIIILALGNILVQALGLLDIQGSFIGRLGGILGVWENVWTNHLVAAASLSLFFLALIFITRGRGMGMGDAKLGFALGLLFGLPDAIVLVLLAFITGAIVAGVMLLLGTKGRKSTVPFGPFLALGAFLVVFFGEKIVSAYLGLIGF